MTEHRIGTQEEWQAARDELLKGEKELEAPPFVAHAWPSPGP